MNPIEHADIPRRCPGRGQITESGTNTSPIE